MKSWKTLFLSMASAVSLGCLLAGCEPSNASTVPGSDSTVQRVIASQIPSLGAATPFAAFGGGAGITNQGVNTVVNGDIGTTGASTMITGFHNASFNFGETPLNIGAVNGLVIGDAPQGSPADLTLAKNVASDALNAFNRLADLPGGIDPAAGLLGGLSLAPGLYKSASGAFLVLGSNLTLDARGDADAIWVFQMASSLTVGGPAAARSVVLVNGAQSKNVYWVVGSSAIINSAGGGTMVGTILAIAGVTISDPGSSAPTTLDGRALAQFGSVTMVNTVIRTPGPSLAVSASRATTKMEEPSPHVVVTGTNAADVAAVADQGFLEIVNNGAHVAATITGTGTIHIVNDGGILTATNTGTGTMTIRSDATGAVTVTITGNGDLTVTATGDEPITLTHTGDEDFTYPALTGVLRRR
ncbi:MAG: DUF3494 domain-containing protein [Fibrobacteres bacterium]|nr:DUF3494 domain-containing protein [Fibrobacterota bacterium]